MVVCAAQLTAGSIAPYFFSSYVYLCGLGTQELQLWGHKWGALHG